MNEQARNLAVGFTVLVALALLGGMILLFTGLPQVFLGGYEIRFAASGTHDAHEGDPVHLSGVRIGRVTDIRFTDPGKPYEGVTFTARIESDIKLPANVRAYFFTKGLVGAAYIELKADGPPYIDPRTGEPLEHFPTDGSIVMESAHVGSSVMPDELTDAIKGVSKLAANLNALLEPEPAPPAATGQAGTETQTASAPAPPPGLRGTVVRLNRTLDAFSAVLGDVENQRNIKTSLKDLAAATAAAKEAMDALKAFADDARRTATSAEETAKSFTELADSTRNRIDDLTQRLIADAEAISATMATINRAAAKIESGEGTAGKLLNDPELYNSLLNTTEQMSRLITEFRELVETWKSGGVELKIK